MMFPFYRQLDMTDCGPTCLRMIAKYYGKYLSTNAVKRAIGSSNQGVSLFWISNAAEKLGFQTMGVHISFEKLKYINAPVILHWNHNHFVVLIKINKSKITLADPAIGIVEYQKEEFICHWQSKLLPNGKGTVLILVPTTEFFKDGKQGQEKY